MKNHLVIILAIIALLICTAAEAKYSGGAGEPNDPYRIADANDLLALAADTNDYSKSFILTADVNLAGQVFTTAIIAPDTVAGNGSFDGTAFTGIFNGNGHKITNFTINGGSNSYLGLFGHINVGGSVKNLGLENFSFSSSAYNVGGLVGSNGGSISNCYSTGAGTSEGDDSDNIGGLVGCNTGSISQCYSTGAVSGGYYQDVGGLVGGNGGSISDCYSTGSVSGSAYTVGGLVGGNAGSISDCYSTSMVSGSRYVGGLVGFNWEGIISNCYSTGTVSGSSNSLYVGGLVGYNYNSGSISNCYSTGAVSGSSYVGGLLGYKSSGSVSSSFWDTQTSEQTIGVGYGSSVGVSGKTTAEMKTLSTFTSAGWDFIEIWGIGKNQTYPYLRTEPVGDLNHDKKVDFEDFAIFASHWLEGTEPY